MWVSKRTGRRRPVTRLGAMLGRTRIALLTGIFALGITGCGGNDGTIPKDDSQQLLNMLTLLENQVETGDCTLAEGTATKIDAAISNLPDSVDPEVQDALSKGAENLTELAKNPDQCTEGASGAQGAQTTDTTSTTTTTTSTEPTSTTETTPETTTSQGDGTGQTQPSNTPPGHQPPTPGNETPPGGGGQTGGPRGEGGGPASGGVTIPGGKR
jgi:hypothetical protein